MTTPQKLGIAAAALLVIGALLGFMPLSSSGVSCGSAFAESHAAATHDLANALGGVETNASGSCDDKLGLTRYSAIVLLLGGAGVGLGALVAHGNAIGRRQDEHAA